MKINRLNTDHVQPQNPLFTSDSQHPPKSRHAVHLGEHWGSGAYQVCSNDDPRLTLTYLMSRSNLLPNAFKWEFF